MGSFGFAEILLIVFVLGLFVPSIFYLITLQNTLETVSLNNRKMSPGLVWLLLIPLFNLIWLFIVVDALAVSLEREYQSKGIETEQKPTYTVGLITAILNICCLIPVIGVFLTLPTFISWIIHWRKVYEHKNALRDLTTVDDPRPTIF